MAIRPHSDRVGTSVIRAIQEPNSSSSQVAPGINTPRENYSPQRKCQYMNQLAYQSRNIHLANTPSQVKLEKRNQQLERKE